MAIAVNDRKIQILTGYGLEGVLPDVVLSRIIRNQSHLILNKDNMHRNFIRFG